MRFRVARKHPLSVPEQAESPKGRWSRGLKKFVGGFASVAVVASSLVIVGGTITASPASAASPFVCEPGSVYVQSTSQVREFAVNVNGGAPGDGGTLGGAGIGTGHSNNGLGISAGGRYAYTIANKAAPQTLAKYDTLTDTTETHTVSVDTSNVLRGAVHPTTGTYYFASGTVPNVPNASGINLFAWDESGAQPQAVQVGVLRPDGSSRPFGRNGDMAFSASGQLILVADNYIYSADIPDDVTASLADIPAKQVHDMGAGVEGNGIAFGNRGHIFVSTSNTIFEVDLARGDVVNQTTLTGFSATDMASCTFPNTLTLKKDLPNGRSAATDQFDLQINSPATYQTTETRAVTNGNVDGVQPDYAGPIFTNQGDTFTIRETAVGTADASRYDTSLSCVQQLGGGATAPVSVSSTNQVVQPAGPLGTEVTCTFVNTQLVPGMELRKTSTPASGTAVSVGEKITYTVEAENTGNTVLDPVTITDDLSGVLAHTTYQSDVTTLIDGTPVASNEASIVGTDLAWTGVLQPGEIVTVTYSVIVNAGVEGKNILNSVRASGTPPGPFTPITPPTVTTENPVAGFTINKTANPATGSVVATGDTIEYTLTGVNTGATTLDPATVSDDLSKVLAHADYNADITTEIDGTPVASGAATITGTDLDWSGSLTAGQTVTIRYSVTVASDAAGKVLSNVVSGSGTPVTPNPNDPNGPPVPGTPVVPPTVTTEHPVVGTGFTISKSAQPGSGTAVEAGDTISYTITGTNTGETVLDPAEITDDLAGVLAHATYNDDVSASIGTATVSGQKLSWSDSIPVGASVTITYSVTVNAGVSSALLKNTVTAKATPLIPTDPTDPNSPTTPGTPIVPPPAETTHPVVKTGFEIAKTANPVSGTAVRGGDVIEYTLTATNTGNTVLDPVALTDDVSAVLSKADYNNDIAATTGVPTITGGVIGWQGALAPGDDVVITYSVTVQQGVSGALLRNTLSGTATPLIPTDPTDPNSPTTPGVPVTPPPSTTEHPLVTPGFTLEKSADPVTGTSVDPGSVITYTVTGTNTGDTALNPIRITDDLTAVLANAVYNGDATATSGTPAVTGNTLSWGGSLAPGQSVEIVYSVTVNADAGGTTVSNSVTGSATPLIPTDPTDPNSPTTPGTPLLPPRVTTEHPVNEPGFTFTKSVDPVSGTAVDPGQVLTYTLVGANTGGTVLTNVDIADDMSKVLAHATYNGDAAATINGAAATVPTLAADRLTWSGPLQVGESVTVTYSVTVAAEAVGKTLENTATATATPPGGNTITPPPGNTTTPVNVPGFSVSKSSVPASGQNVDPGSTITYTVTGVNTGQTGLNPVTITDDLSGVLAHAVYNGDAAASVGGAPAAAPTVVGDALTWTGALPVGASVSVTYSVTVKGDAGGEVLKNSVHGVATPPGGVPPITTPPSVVEHPVNKPGFEITKTANPATGVRVDPGSVITYTVTGANTGQTKLDPVEITDDLSGVLSHAVYNDDAAAVIGGTVLAAPAVSNGKLSWAGMLEIGERVSITYSVTVKADAGGETVKNLVTGRAVPPGGTELTPPPTTTEHPVAKPGFEFVKTSNPATGTAIATGGVVTYTLTGVNTGQTELKDVVITDDLSQVLPHADIQSAAVAKVDGSPAASAPTLTGTVLNWTGTLAAGQTVTVTYAVKVHADAAGKTLKNAATATATPPGGEKITPPPSTTEHPVLTPLALTGGLLLPWVLGLGVTLLLGGALLMLVRRRNAAA